MPGTIAVIFHGQECTEYAAFGQLLDSISGSIQMYDTGCWDASPAATGTLEVFDSFKLPPSQVPFSNETLVSILGTYSVIQLCSP